MNRNSAPRTARGRARALLSRLHREEDGQTLLLGVGLICVVLALLFVAASATAVYLDLKTLTSLADSAAAAGADSVEAHPYYGGGVTDDAPGSLTDAGVGSKAAEDLSAQPAADRRRDAAGPLPPALPPVGDPPGRGLHHHRHRLCPNDDDAVSRRTHCVEMDG